MPTSGQNMDSSWETQGLGEDKGNFQVIKITSEPDNVVYVHSPSPGKAEIGCGFSLGVWGQRRQRNNCLSQEERKKEGKGRRTEERKEEEKKGGREGRKEKEKNCEP